MDFGDSGFVPFTWGVWTSDGAMVHGNEANRTIVAPDGMPPNQEKSANLALIAQAPVMYDLLREVLAEHDGLKDKIVPVLQAARIIPR